ncbi:MAG: N-acetyltransferase [Prevotella sp.]|nr:N-acetyltransferase [Candidatus Prevotella equi]
MVEIKRIESERDIKKFIDFRTALYKDDPCAVPYLYMDEHDALSKKKNRAFAFCEAEYYLAYKDGKVVGRVAAIINHKANKRWNRKSVRFGYFDFIDDLEVSTALIDTVKAYGREKGMEHIIGPVGFIDMDREGMLVEGFDVMATMHANHNYAYYPEHINAIGGFEKDNDWVQQMVKVPEKVPEKFVKITEMIGKRYNLRAKKVTRKELVRGGYAKRLFQILNECYKDLYEFSELDDTQIDQLIESYINLADTNLVSLVFDETEENKMVGFGVSFPSFSKALRRTKTGKLFPFGWFHLARTLFFHDTDVVDLLLIGVLPEYRAKGANALIFDDLIKCYNRYGFKNALTLAMMETNNGVLSAWQHFDAKTVKRLRSYKAKL